MFFLVLQRIHLGTLLYCQHYSHVAVAVAVAFAFVFRVSSLQCIGIALRWIV